MPVENSTEGVIARSLDLFLTGPLVILCETSLAVRHNLLRRENRLDGLTAICAHPQALAQCNAWLSERLPGIERRPVASNAEGARLASLEPSLGALASLNAQRVRSPLLAQRSGFRTPHPRPIVNPPYASATACFGPRPDILVVSVATGRLVHDLRCAQVHGV